MPGWGGGSEAGGHLCDRCVSAACLALGTLARLCVLCWRAWCSEHLNSSLRIPSTADWVGPIPERSFPHHRSHCVLALQRGPGELWEAQCPLTLHSRLGSWDGACVVTAHLGAALRLWDFTVPRGCWVGLCRHSSSQATFTDSSLDRLSETCAVLLPPR